MDDLHNEHVRLQAVHVFAEDVLHHERMQVFEAGRGEEQGGLKVAVGEKGGFSVHLQQLPVKGRFHFEDSAFVGHSMRMGYRSFEAGLGDEHAAGIGIQRAAENIEQEISFPHETDAECGIVLRFGGSAGGAAAFEIEHLVKARAV